MFVLLMLKGRRGRVSRVCKRKGRRAGGSGTTKASKQAGKQASGGDGATMIEDRERRRDRERCGFPRVGGLIGDVRGRQSEAGGLGSVEVEGGSGKGKKRRVPGLWVRLLSSETRVPSDT